MYGRLKGVRCAGGRALAAKDRGQRLRRQWQEIGEDALAAVDRVGRSGWLILGEEVRGLRARSSPPGGAFRTRSASPAASTRSRSRCAASSCRPGARVLTTPLTAFATTLAILRAGAEPVWCDVDDSGGLDLERADAALRRRRRDPGAAAGAPLRPSARPRALERLAAEHGVPWSRTAPSRPAPSAAARRPGAAGAVAATSLYPTKNLGALGDGGVAAHRRRGARRARAQRCATTARAARYEHVELGLNSRLDELQAAILRSALLPRLDALAERAGGEIAARYAAALGRTAAAPDRRRAGAARLTISSRSRSSRATPAAVAARPARGAASPPAATTRRSAPTSPRPRGAASPVGSSCRRPPPRRARALAADPSVPRATTRSSA